MIIARAADFQAAWYFSLLLLVILLIVVVGAAFVLAAARRLWRQGERGPAAVIGASTLFGLLVLLGMYATALGGIILTSKGGGS